MIKLSENIEAEIEPNHWVCITNGKDHGYIKSQSVEANLLYAIVEKLEVIRISIQLSDMP